MCNKEITCFLNRHSINIMTKHDSEIFHLKLLLVLNIMTGEYVNNSVDYIKNNCLAHSNICTVKKIAFLIKYNMYEQYYQLLYFLLL